MKCHWKAFFVNKLHSQEYDGSLEWLIDFIRPGAERIIWPCFPSWLVTMARRLSSFFFSFSLNTEILQLSRAVLCSPLHRGEKATWRDGLATGWTPLKWTPRVQRTHRRTVIGRESKRGLVFNVHMCGQAEKMESTILPSHYLGSVIHVPADPLPPSQASSRLRESRPSGCPTRYYVTEVSPA